MSNDKSKSIGERMKTAPKDDGGVGRLKLKGGMVLKKAGKKCVIIKFVILFETGLFLNTIYVPYIIFPAHY